MACTGTSLVPTYIVCVCVSVSECMCVCVCVYIYVCVCIQDVSGAIVNILGGGSMDCTE